MKILVVADHSSGQIKGNSLEALAMAQALAGAVEGVVDCVAFGDRVEEIASRLAGFKVNSVQMVNAPELAEYDPHVHAEVLTSVIRQLSPELVFLAHSYQNMDLVPLAAARFRVGAITDCTGFRVEDGELLFERQVFRGKLLALVRASSASPVFVTVQTGAFSSDDVVPGHASVSEVAVDLSGVRPRRKVLESFKASKGRVDLAKAEVIVAVGRGIKKEDNIALVKDLADALKAELGASRPVVDSGWLERERQIGSSGQTVAPRLYLALGISGAIQHVVGMKGANCVVAVNSDPNAPIFNVANYGIVGDLAEIVPALTRRLREDVSS